MDPNYMSQMFFANCEMVLFRILVRLHEGNKIDIKELIKSDLISNLKGLQPIDKELNENVDVFLNLPNKAQKSSLVALDMRIREYCKNNGIEY